MKRFTTFQNDLFAKLKKALLSRFKLIGLTALLFSFHTLWAQTGPAGVNTDIKLWLDASDISTLYQNTAGTTPVTDEGDPVAMWEDKSGLGQHVTQGTVNRQPLYRSNVSNFNSQPAIDFDGGDWMSCNLFSNWSGDYTLFIALQSDVPNPVKFESFFSNAAGPGTAGAFQIHYMDTSLSLIHI